MQDIGISLSEREDDNPIACRNSPHNGASPSSVKHAASIAFSHGQKDAISMPFAGAALVQ